MVFIPAGSLDEEPDIGPQARIFTGSRTAWSCDGAGPVPRGSSNAAGRSSHPRLDMQPNDCIIYAAQRLHIL
jgi:hypothetical protein